MNFFVRIFKKDILRKLVALAFAILLYWTMSSQVEEKFDNVVLDVHYPDGIVNVGENNHQVSLHCTVSQYMLSALREKGVKGTVKISIKNYVPNKPYTVKLTEDNFHLPFGVKVDKISPDTLIFNLDQEVERKVKVVVPSMDQDKLPMDYQVRSVTVSPEEITIIGPASVVNAIKEIKTESIPLDGSIREDFEYAAKLVLPNNVTASIGTINCRIDVSKDMSMTINDVPINCYNNIVGNNADLIYELAENTVDVILHGSKHDLEDCAGKIRPYVDLSTIKEKGVYDLEVKCFIDGVTKAHVSDVTPKIIKVIVK